VERKIGQMDDRVDESSTGGHRDTPDSILSSVFSQKEAAPLERVEPLFSRDTLRV
jgi:hypothetical protein